MPGTVLTVEQVRRVESRAASGAVSLMSLAGAATARAARRLARDDGNPVLVLAGPGNNGGDAWVAAAELAQGFSRVVVLDATGVEPPAAEARAARDRLAGLGVRIVRAWPAELRPALILDGLLGIGLTRDVGEDMRPLIQRVNEAGAPVLAIDVPSGLDADTGGIRGCAVRASVTVTFIAFKAGLFTGDGPDHAGDVMLEALGTEAWTQELEAGELTGVEDVRHWLTPRQRNSHKGAFGTLGIVGGEQGMAGAAMLAGRAALLAGAGRVRLAMLGRDSPPVDFAFPELMIRVMQEPVEADVHVAGPGAGGAASSLGGPFEKKILPALVEGDTTLVLDADGLNALARSETLGGKVATRKAATILTPHPAEAARLLDCDTPTVQADRVGSARELARRFNAHVVLKGAGSVCASPDGKWSINRTGNPALAAAGTGDVLAGLIGAMLCQRLSAERALRLAVCLHGAAADALVARGHGPLGVTASDVALECRALLNEWGRGRNP